MNHDAFSIAQKPLAVLSRSRSLPLSPSPRRSAELLRPRRRQWRGRKSGAGAIAGQEAVVAIFGDLPPQVLIVAKSERRFPRLLEIRIGGRDLVVELERRLETGVHHGRLERLQLGARGD